MDTQSIKASPRDFFLYLLSNVALYYCAGWLVSLLYDYINYSFGSVDFSYQTSWLPDSMRWAIASLIIVFPVYILVTRRLNADLVAAPEKKDLWVRKWLIYLTLALASIALVIDLVALVNEFLSGEFATTFLLKTLAVAVVAGMIFDYYFYELRRDAGKFAPARALFRWMAIGLVVVSVVSGFFIVGSPEEARARRYDFDRVDNLQNIQWQIVNYWQKKEALPKSLTDLNDPIAGYTVPVDPVTGTSYDYALLSEKAFELCATFDLASRNPQLGPAPLSGLYKSVESSNWTHEQGRVCFERTIDSDLYPPQRESKPF